MQSISHTMLKIFVATIGSIGFVATLAVLGISQSSTQTTELSAPKQRIIEVSVPVEALVILCGSDRASEVIAANQAIKAQTEKQDVIAKATFDAAKNFPQTCNQSQMANPSTPARFSVGSGYYVTVAGNVLEEWSKVEEHR
jgi:hypothetical protein